MSLSTRLIVSRISLIFLVATSSYGTVAEDGLENILQELDQQTLEFVEHPLSNSTVYGGESQWLKQQLVPEYLQEFFKLLSPQPGAIEDELVERLFLGVNNDDCRSHVMEALWRFLNLGKDRNFTVIASDEEKWVLQLFDAWGKIPEGILSGHINAYGDFNECVDVEVSNLEYDNKYHKNGSKSFEGLYCTTNLIPNNLGTNNLVESSRIGGGIQPRKAVSFEELLKILREQQFGFNVVMMIPSIALCMPNSCSLEEIQQMVTNAWPVITKAAKIDPKAVTITPVTSVCHQAKKPDFDWAAIFVIVLISSITALCVGAGILDFYQSHGLEKPPARTKPMKFFMAFSLYTNITKWLSTRRSAEDFGCLHGIRFLSTSWVVLCHTFDAFRTSPIIWNWIDVKNIYEHHTMLAVFNGTYSVDTFFVMSGFLATYNIMKMLDKTKGKMNIVMFYVHRYLRLTPVYAILVAIGATLLSYLGRGPNWAFIETAEGYCRTNWWTNLLYVNNLVHTNKMCNGESWYLANDMQFYILSPFIVYPMWRWPKTGLSLLVVYTVLSIIAPVLVVHYGNAPPAMVLTGYINLRTFVNIYIRPWSRIQTFFVGVWLGWLLYTIRGKKFSLTLPIVLCGWALSTAICLTVIFAIHPWFDPANRIPEVPGLFYAGLSRFAFGVCVAWVMFACIKGYGGLVNSFLSWSVFMPLGRLSFCVYLTSLHLQQIFQSRWPSPIRYDRYTMVNFYFAHLVMSNFVGFCATLLFESPFMILQRLIFEGR